MKFVPPSHTIRRGRGRASAPARGRRALRMGTRSMGGLVAALAAAVLTSLAAAPAMAAAEPAWERIACSSGSIGTATVDTTWEGNFLTLAGKLYCVQEQAGAAFGYGIYAPGYSKGFVYASHLRPYSLVGAMSSPFSDRKRLPVGQASFAICVITDYQVRVDCVRVGRSLLASDVEVRPLDITDPLVGKPVELVRDEDGPWPVCGTCW